MRNDGFSLIEILVSMVLLAVVGAVTMQAFTSSTKVTQNDSAAAYNFGRGILEQFFERVRQDQWANGGLPLSLANVPARPPILNNPKNLNGKTYTAVYTVNNNSGVAQDVNGDGQEDYRRVTLTVNWV